MLTALFFCFSQLQAKPAASSQTLKCEIVANKEDTPFLQIKLIAEGFSPFTPVQLTTIRLTNKAIFPAALMVNEKNEVVLQANQQPLVLKLTPYSQEDLHGFARGEPVQYIVLVEKTKLSASTTIIPFPNEITDGNGHTLSLDCTKKDKSVFTLKATGFESHEVVDTISIVGEQIEASQAVASEQGIIVMVLTPAADGKSSGQGSFEIKGKTTKGLKVNYEFGSNETKANSILNSLIKCFKK